MKYASRSHDIKGFTLIEMVVAISLLAILATLVASEFRTGLNASSTISREAERLHRRETTLSVLQEQLRGALPLLYWTGEGLTRRSRLSLEGDEFSIRFVSRASFIDGSLSVPRWIELQWKHPFESRTGWLEVQERRILSPNNNPDPTPYWRGRILEGRNLKFEYLRRAKTARPPQWTTSWDPTRERELPAAVRITYLTDGRDSVLIIPVETAPTSWRGLSLQ
jgi:prepilin-type N-terminal cleavage/methylation domain-containing protein